MQWVVTVQFLEVFDPNKDGQTSIEALATRLAYDPLFWKGWNGMTPTSYPNVVLMDFIWAAGV